MSVISNTQQKVTDKYRNNPFWDKKPKLCKVCGKPLDNKGNCTEQLRSQKERT